MRAPALALLWILALGVGGTLAAQSPEDVAGIPEAGAALVDPDFAVTVQALGLRREVQMHQWTREGGEFSTAWLEERVDATQFPPIYANPPEPSYGSARWLAEDARLEGRRMAPELLAGLDGWVALPVDEVAAALPPNLAMVFQPAGNWLSSSVDPDAPVVGDLRIRWWQLPGGPLQATLVDIDGTWQAPGPEVELVRGEDADPVPLPADGIPGLPERERGSGLPMLLGLMLIAAALGVGIYLFRRRRRR